MLDTSKIYTSKNNGRCKVLEYIDSSNVVVEFLDTGYICTSEAASVKKGLVKDRLKPNVCGVGFVGVGGYDAAYKRVPTKPYVTWKSMLERCYGNVQKRCPTYKGVTVCNEWHNFQVFAQWFNDNYIDGFQLDKDIKTEGNKIYSPSTCLFVSRKDNSIKAVAKSYTFTNPEGLIVDVYNLVDFCLKNNLNRSGMSKVSTGVRGSYKGWKIA
ncbi:MAG: hypothetical protein COA78_21060 [Blastopirellula sp.]|nr:MAG: hypothetical protein COA78_21060 [Blastopirellula sp.]